MSKGACVCVSGHIHMPCVDRERGGGGERHGRTTSKIMCVWKERGGGERDRGRTTGKIGRFRV